MSDSNYLVAPKIKVITIGDQSVGKSSLLKKFLNDEFEFNYTPTIGIDFSSKQLMVHNKPIKLQLWDTAGQERFRSLIPSYIKGSHVVFILYDITRKKSLLSTEYWFDLVFKSGRSDANVFLVGNKLDLEENREVPYELGKKYADDNKAQFYETSALTGHNIRNLFFKAAQDYVKMDEKIMETEMIDPDKPSEKIDTYTVFNQENIQLEKDHEERKCCKT